jgi:hypothetical protein
MPTWFQAPIAGLKLPTLNSSQLFCGEHFLAYVKLHNTNEILQVILFRGREAAINDPENVYREAACDPHK